MSDVITCPSCSTEIEVSEVMTTQLTDQIRRELNADFAQKRAALDERQRAIESAKAEIEDAKQQFESRVRAEVAAQQKRLVEQARTQAKHELSLEFQQQADELEEARLKLRESQANELALRKKERELESKATELELEVTRRIDAERESIRDEARRQSDEQHQMKDLEKEKQIADMRKQIDDLKRKAEQGSQQNQGEVQELALEELLDRQFPADEIIPVPKGTHGGDATQSVRDGNGLECGEILWESKRTKKWSDTWLPKLREDQRNGRADIAVIVSSALPKDVHTFAYRDGVWICSWACVSGLATALRAGLIEASKARRAVHGQQEKTAVAYRYLSSPQFQHRVEAIVEAFVTLAKDLDAEKRAIQKLWAKREKQLELAVSGTAGLYGDLQGIIGGSLPEIANLEMPLIEGEKPADAA